MGREIRQVPQGWQHPRYTTEDAPRPSMIGRHRPQFQQTHSELSRHDPQCAPDPADCREEALAGGECRQLYESTTEGTPLSPVFNSTDELLKHLATHGDDEGKLWPEEAIAVLRKNEELMTSDCWKYKV